MAQSQSNVRQAFIRSNPGIQRPGHPGYWYRCAHCGKWCGRPGRERAAIPDDCKMEVDHIMPWSLGGSDEVYNLQPLCKPCNRSKSANASIGDNIKSAGNAILHPVDTFVKTPLRKAVRQNSVLKSLGITKRR